MWEIRREKGEREVGLLLNRLVGNWWKRRSLTGRGGLKRGFLLFPVKSDDVYFVACALVPNLEEAELIRGCNWHNPKK